MYPRYSHYISTLFLLLLSLTVLSKEATYIDAISKVDINVGNKLYVDSGQLPMFTSPAVPIGTMSDPNYVIERDYEVALVYDRSLNSDVLGKYWRYRVHYEISYPLSNLPKEQGFIELQFEPGSGIYEELKLYELIDSYDAEIVITNIEAADHTGNWSANMNSNSFGFLPGDISLELRMQVSYYERLYVYSSGIPSSLTDNLTGDNLLLSWQPAVGAESYELEYTFIDYEVLDINLANANRWKKAVRIELEDPYYEFNLIYPKGTLYYRVRSVGRHIQSAVNNDYSHVRFSMWSQERSKSLSGFEDEKSWQSVVSYAENGKRKQVVSYFDESMRSRQTQTYLSTDILTLVAETDYDVEGRSSVSILPAPAFDAQGVATAGLGFRPNFNRNSSGDTYSYRDFDKTNGADPLASSSGAGYYYSDQNNSNLLYNGYMGDAKGYPITQVQMLHDGTGRAWKQGGIGAFYQINTRRATQYAYGNPNETELRRLFGKNVGDVSHYKKTLVKDANDQVSVSYIDQAGQVIATALAGESPDNVMALGSQVNGGVPITANLSMEPTIFETSTGLVARTENVILNTVPSATGTSYSFNYNLTGTTNYIDSLGYCDTCEYEVTIRILKPDGTYVDNINYNGINSDVVTIPYTSSYNSGCSTNSTDLVYPYPNGMISFTTKFYELGNYRVIKEVRVPLPNLDTLQWELGQAGLLPNFQSYLDSAMLNIDTLICILDDSTYCTAWALETFPNLTGTALQTQIDSCMVSNGNYTLSSDQMSESAHYNCESSLIQLKFQMSPGGLYYEHALLNGWSDIPSIDSDIDPSWHIAPIVSSQQASLFLIIDENQDEYLYTDFGTPQFMGPNGSTATVGSLNVYDKSTLGSRQINAIDFIDNVLLDADLWQSQWTESLVYRHPEYCHYEHCISNEASAAFDLQISLYNEWSDGFSGTLYTNSTSIISIDPYFSNLGGSQGGAIGDSIMSILATITNITNPNYTPNITSNYANWSTTNQDSVRWILFRGMYLNSKQILMEEAITATGCAYLESDFAIFKGSPDPLEDSEGEKQAWVGEQMDDFCDGICIGQVQGWIFEIRQQFALLACQPTLSLQDSIDIYNHLLSYCNNSCGAANPLGELLAEDVGVNNDLLSVEAILATYTCTPSSGGTISGGNLIDSISISSSVVYTPILDGGGNQVYTVAPCFQAFISAINQYLLPNGISGSPYCTYNGTSSISYNCIGTLYESCFSQINISGAIFGASYYCQLSTYDGGQQAGYIGMKFIDSAGNEYIGVDCIEQIVSTVPTTVPPTTIPSGWLYSGLKIELLIDGNLNTDYYIIFADDALPCEILTPAVSVNNSLYTETINVDTLEQNCIEELLALAYQQAQDAWQENVNRTMSAYIQENHCLESPFAETFNVSYRIHEHHYTLYYYDQSGSLVQTVPPEGVKPLEQGVDEPIDENGIWDGITNPNHKLKTNYRYNSIGGVTYQHSPDGGTTEFYYDRVGRIRFSQNENQRSDNPTSSSTPTLLSFTKYDEQGRIDEVGELEINNLIAVDALTTAINNIDNQNYPDATVQTVSQLTKTYYDEAPQATFQQDNLRGRVAMVENDNIITAYSYDVHGNVKEMRHEVPNFGEVSLEYDYDLVSGNVKEVIYQKGKLDAFHHRYTYDADNRIRQVYTSEYGRIWDKDAEYLYYAHGPLARIELGHDDIQGLDYYYTLQGWIKGVNMPGDVAGQYDLGHDGQIGNPNQYFARDEYAYALGYHEQDYSPIGGNNVTLAPTLNNTWNNMSGNILDRDYGTGTPIKGLFNGNIAYMLTDLPELAKQDIGDRMNGMAYQYDALHRIREAKSYKWDHSGIWETHSSASNNKNYNVSYTYDANGNIKTLNRNSLVNTASSGLMDQLAYIYNYDTDGDLANNRLRYVKDNATTALPGTTNYLGDMQNNTAYIYDEIGNLINEDNEYIDEIKWNVQGKVDAVIYNSQGHSLGRKDLSFTYDASGNRLTKRIEGEEAKITYYMRDASGNVMMVYTAYEYRNEYFTYRDIFQSEAHLYGSSRLGIKKYERVIAKVQIPNGETPEEEKLGQLVEDLKISEVNYDSPLTPNNAIQEVHVGEYVALYNVSLEPMDLSNITILNKMNTVEHNIANGTTLQSGQTLLFAYGSPTDQADFLKANNLENKVDPNHVLWYWQTDVTLGDNGGDVIVLWRHPIKGKEVLVDAVAFGWEEEIKAENEYYDITQPIGTPRSSVVTLRRDLSKQIERRREMYEKYGLAEMYYQHLNKRLDQTIEGQIQYLKQQTEEKGREKFNIEVATGEITTAFYAANNNAYAPHSPEDFTISAFQWYEEEEKYGQSNSSKVEGEVSYNKEAFKYRRQRGKTYYELSNHLGNVLVSVTDMKVGISTDGDFFAEYYEATVVSANDYYPFGSAMAGRKYSSNAYRYGFNGMEKDDEMKGEGNSYDFGARLYDSRVGRWLAVDPLAAKYPAHSSYTGIGNNPIIFIDPDGRKLKFAGSWKDRKNLIYNVGKLYFKSKTGRKLVRELINSDNIVTIRKGDSNTMNRGHDVKVNGKYVKQAIITLNSVEAEENYTKADGGKDNESIPNTIESTIAHELQHVKDHFDGKLLRGIRLINPKNLPRTDVDGAPFLRSNSISPNDVSAVETENKVRAELGLPPRYYYDNIYVFNKEVSEKIFEKKYNVNGRSKTYKFYVTKDKKNPIDYEEVKNNNKKVPEIQFYFEINLNHNHKKNESTIDSVE